MVVVLSNPKLTEVGVETIPLLTVSVVEQPVFPLLTAPETAEIAKVKVGSTVA